MAYLVVLSFEDDEQALTLVEDILAYPGSKILTPALENDVKGKVEAIYKRPTMFCDPTDRSTHSGGKMSYSFTKGQKYGWWVCVSCKKPSKLFWESVMEKESSFGKNQLKVLFTDD
jgi:hypothetical protein